MPQRSMPQKHAHPIATLLLVLVALPVVGCQPARPTLPPVAKPSAGALKSEPASAPPTADQANRASTSMPQPAPSAKDTATGVERAAEAPPAVSNPRQKLQPPTPQTDEAGGDPWLPPAMQLPISYWEALYRNAQRIGVTRYDIESIGDPSGRLRLTMTSSMPLIGVQRPQTRILKVETLEQANGNLDTLTEISVLGLSEIIQSGSVTNKTLRLAGQVSGTKQISWPDGSWGPMGIHQLLLRRPMRSGEIRVANVFLSQHHQMARMTLVAGQTEDTTSPDGLLREMIPIEVLMQTEKEGIRVRLWANSDGWVYKTIWPAGLNFSSFRVSQEAGQRMFSQAEAQVMANSSIELSATQFELISDKMQAAYTIDSSKADPHQLFSHQSNQQVQSLSAYRARVRVVHPQAMDAATSGQQLEPSPACLASSWWIAVDDPVVAELAAELAGDEGAPEQVAARLAAGVSQRLKPMPYAVEFRRAGDVARTGQGDIADSAVLLTALLRNRGIPARLVSGIRVNSSEGRTRFVYHMWTDAWLGQRWWPLDASTGQVAGCGYIRFLESPLEQSDPYELVLPVLKSLDQLKITLEPEAR